LCWEPIPYEMPFLPQKKKKKTILMAYNNYDIQQDPGFTDKA